MIINFLNYEIKIHCLCISNDTVSSNTPFIGWLCYRFNGMKSDEKSLISELHSLYYCCIDILQHVSRVIYNLLMCVDCCSPLVVSDISDMVMWLMNHVLSVNPRHPSWLHTQADIHFGKHFMSVNCSFEVVGLLNKIRCPATVVKH